MTCNITGIVRTPDGALFKNGTITFYRQSGVGSMTDGSDSYVVIPEKVKATTNSAGEINTTLTYGSYRATAEGVERTWQFLVGVPNVSTISFYECVELIPELSDTISGAVLGYKEDAEAAADTATTKAGEASTSAGNAADSATTAQKWAANPEDTEVSGGLYSALHYAAKASDSATAAEAAALTADVHKDTFTALDAATDIISGQIVSVADGFNGQRENGLIVPASTYTADGSLVRDLTGISGQWVSYRREFASFDEMVNQDPRTFAAGTTLTIPSIDATYSTVATSGNLGQTNAGGQEFDVVPKGGELLLPWFGAPSDGVSDCWAALSAAKSAAIANSCTLRLPLGASSGTYFIAQASQSSPDLFGVRLAADPGVVLSVYDIAFVNYKAWQLETELDLYVQSRNVHQYLLPNTATEHQLITLASSLGINDGITSPEAIDFTTWEQRKYATWPSNVWSSSTTGTVDSTSVSYAIGAVTSPFDGIFGNPEVGKYYSASFDVPVTGADPGSAVAGVIVQCGTYVFRFALYNTATAIRYVNVYQWDGSTYTNITGNISVPVAGYGIQSLSVPTVGVRFVTAENFEFYVNGWKVASVQSNPGNAAFGVGFVLSNSTNSVASSINNGTVARADWMPSGKKLKLSYIGDSITFGAAQTLPFPDLLPYLIKGYGYADVTVVQNIAYPGDKAANQATAAASADFSTSDYALVMVGTNDIQAQTSISSFRTSVESIISSVQADGAVPIIGIPPMYSSTAITGAGFNALNYALGGRYRTELLRIAAENNLVVADMQSEFGIIDSVRSTTFDNLHPNQLGSVLAARAYAKAILAADSATRVDHIGESGSALMGGYRVEWRSSLPASGYYRIGDTIINTAPSVLGTSGSQYIIDRWRRITNGRGNVLNTDWVEARSLTGT
ncbi:SGNH/GDSL hydrolase family protein [Thioclava sp. DLFJ4-1]|uniref:SGNH/GDSL hydrolase family protein n=1 Tax=Thioclava sp. DLFJ4-1 TaxID=1915313 RepID=UPI00099779ED|nr:SGNH/GDSL hydrolase family protein [Thioclava sp. DLFJ4-1]OOY15061.1 hypothetical protein BMI85_16060 [Thioclava sp. DLFJ4-1]